MRLHRLLLATAFVQTAVVLVTGLVASPAEACSPLMPPDRFYTFQDSLPRDGATGVPLDGAILLVPREWRVSDATAEVDDRFAKALSVTVTDTETGEPVPGRLLEWWGLPSGIAWKAESPLQPNRRYALTGTLQQVHSRPANAEGPTELRRTFTTGAQASAPLELLGSLSVRLEPFETDKLQCTPGHCGCDVVGREMATRARIQLPGVRGGAPLGSYRYELWVTDRTPYQFDVPNHTLPHEVVWGVWAVHTPGTPAETSFTMPRNPHEKAWPPCFAWRAVDPAGNTVEGPPVCLDQLVPAPAQPIDREQGDDIIEAPGPLGCTTGHGSATGTASLALLGLVAVLWRSRALRPSRRG